MKLDIGKTEFKIDVTFAAAVTLTLILDESGAGALALFCCIIHEIGHIVCLLLFGEKPKSVTLSFYGIKLERSGEYWGRARSVPRTVMVLVVYSIGTTSLSMYGTSYVAGRN